MYLYVYSNKNDSKYSILLKKIPETKIQDSIPTTFISPRQFAQIKKKIA